VQRRKRKKERKHQKGEITFQSWEKKGGSIVNNLERKKPLARQGIISETWWGGTKKLLLAKEKERGDPLFHLTPMSSEGKKRQTAWSAAQKSAIKGARASPMTFPRKWNEMQAEEETAALKRCSGLRLGGRECAAEKEKKKGRFPWGECAHRSVETKRKKKIRK